MIRPAVEHTYESSRQIPAPPEEVFALLADGVRLLELESEPEGAPMRRVVTAQDRGDGVYEVQMRLGRTQQAYEVTVEEFEEGRRVVYTRPGLRTEYEVEPDRRGHSPALHPPLRRRPRRRGRDGLRARRLDEESAVAGIDEHLAAISLVFKPPEARELTETGGFAAAILVEQPPSAVFAFVSNPANVPSWLGGDSEVEHLGGPLVGAGARYRLTRDPAARLPESSELTTHRVRAAAPGRPSRSRATRWTSTPSTPAPDGTRLTLERRPERRPRGFLARLGARARFTPERMVPGDRAPARSDQGRIGELRGALPGAIWTLPSNGQPFGGRQDETQDHGGGGPGGRLPGGAGRERAGRRAGLALDAAERRAGAEGQGGVPGMRADRHRGDPHRGRTRRAGGHPRGEPHRRHHGQGPCAGEGRVEDGPALGAQGEAAHDRQGPLLVQPHAQVREGLRAGLRGPHPRLRRHQPGARLLRVRARDRGDLLGKNPLGPIEK